MQNTWNGIMNEMGNYPNAFDVVRKKYIKKLSDLTGRNTIVYYSGWLQHPDGDSSIDDSDMEGFMNAVNELDCTKGFGPSYTRGIAYSCRSHRELFKG